MNHNEYASVLAHARKLANDLIQTEEDLDDEREKKERERLDVLGLLSNQRKGEIRFPCKE